MTSVIYRQIFNLIFMGVCARARLSLCDNHEIYHSVSEQYVITGYKIDHISAPLFPCLILMSLNALHGNFVDPWY